MGAPVIRKNDIVVVRQGKDKGKTGKVHSVQPEKSRVVSSGVNIVKHFIRPAVADRQGGIMESEAPLHAAKRDAVCTRMRPGRPARVKRPRGRERRSRYCPQVRRR